MIYLVIHTDKTGHELVEAIFKDKADARTYIDNRFPDTWTAYRIDERMLQ